MESSSNSRKAWRRGGLLLGAVLLVGAALITWRVHALQAQAREQIAGWLSAATGAQARVADAQLDLRQGLLVAHGVEVSDHGRSLVHDGELRAYYAWRSVWRGELALRRLELSAQQLQVSARELTRPRPETAVAQLIVTSPDVILELDEGRRLQLRDLHFELQAERVQLRSSAATLTHGTETVVHARVAADGTWRAGQGQGPLQLTLLEAAGRAWPEPSALRWRAAGQQLAITGDYALPNAQGSAQYTLALSPTGLTLELRPKALQLSAALAQLATQPPPMAARVDGVITLQGTLTPLMLTGPARLSARELRLGAAPIIGIAQLEAAGDVQLTADGLTLSQLTLTLPHGRFRGQAQANAAGELTLAVDAQELSLEDLGRIGTLAVAGHGQVALRAQGAWRAPQLHATMVIADAALGGIALGQLDASLAVSDGGRVLDVERIAISQGEERQLSARAVSLRVEQGLAEAHAHVNVARLPLVELYRALGVGDDPALVRLQAQTSGEAQLDYRRGSPLELGLALRLVDARLAERRFDTGELRARCALPEPERGLAGGVLTVERLLLHADGGTLQLNGSLRRGALDLQLALHELQLARDPWLHAQLPQLTGRVSGQGHLRGDSEAPQVEARLTTGELTLRDLKLGAMQLWAAVREPAAAQCGELRASPGEWLVCGHSARDQLRLGLAIAASRTLRGQLALHDFALGPWLHAPGSVSASLAISAGQLGALDQLDGELNVSQLRLGDGESAVSNPEPFTLHIHKGELSLEQARLRGPQQQYTLSAAGSLAHDPRVIADGTLAASLLTRRSQPTLAAYGDLSVHVTWQPRAPQVLEGTALPKDLTLVIAGGKIFHVTAGALKLQGQRVLVERLGAALGKGQLQLSGRLGLEGLTVRDYALQLTASRVPFEPERLIQLTLSADTQLAWSGGERELPRLTGEITLERGSYGKPFGPEMLYSLGSRIRGEHSGAERLALDLTLRQQQPLHVHNSFVDAEVHVVGADRALHLTGTDRQLGLLGQLAVEHGRVTFQNEVFDVTHAGVVFGDSTRITPQFQLDARAITQDHGPRRGADVRLHAQGSHEAFAIAVHCSAQQASPLPAPFTCDYKGERMRCDTLEQLSVQWACRDQPKLSRAAQTR